MFVGIQALLWMSTGAIMSYLKIDHVRSEHVISREPELLTADKIKPLWLGGQEELTSITTKSVAGQSMIEVRHGDGTVSLHDPATGARLSPLSRASARKIAERAWSGPPTAASNEQLVKKVVGTEFAGPLPAWQVTFSDPDATRLYIDASSGTVLAARSDTWRFFDFVWGLHIMDWTQRDRINSWWLLLFGIGGTLIALSGFILLANRFPKVRKGAPSRDKS